MAFCARFDINVWVCLNLKFYVVEIFNNPWFKTTILNDLIYVFILQPCITNLSFFSLRRSFTSSSLFASLKFLNNLFVDPSHGLDFDLLYFHSLIELVVFLLVYDCILSLWCLFWVTVFILSYLNEWWRWRNFLLYWRIAFRFW